MIVTFDTLRVDNSPIFSNGNLTVRFLEAVGKAISNKALDNGKFYLEIKLDTVGKAPYIGIFDNNQYTTVFNSLNSDYPPYDNRENLIITTKLYEITTAGDIFSLLIDTINKKFDIYINNILFKSYTFNFNNANIIVGCGNDGGGGNAQFTVNFGASNFKYNIPTGFFSYDLNQTSYLSLIKQNNQYNSIKEDFYDVSTDSYDSPVISELTLEKFSTYAIGDLSKIHINAFNKLINDKFNIVVLK